jgi:predicted RNA-binding Zn-ribbon protein involved in translation (DUF1610 family)
MSEMSAEHVRCSECGTTIEESPGTRVEERQPCPNCGSTIRTIRVVGGVVARVVAGGIGKVIPAPSAAACETQRLQEIGRLVTWYVYPDGQHLILVHDDEGNLLDAGGGDDPVDSILKVAQRLLPRRRLKARRSAPLRSGSSRPTIA